jgi:hypothetical protein
MAATTVFTSRDFRQISAPNVPPPSPETDYIVVDRESAPHFAKLYSFQELRHGWNQGRGDVITREAILKAARILQDAIRHFRAAPDVMPLESGGVLLEWERNARALQIQVSRRGEASYGVMVEDELEGEGILASALPELMNWLLMDRELAYA